MYTHLYACVLVCVHITSQLVTSKLRFEYFCVGVTPIPLVIYIQALLAVSLLEKDEFRNTGLTEVRTVKDVPTTVDSLSLEVTCLPAYVREGFASTIRSQ